MKVDFIVLESTRMTATISQSLSYIHETVGHSISEASTIFNSVNNHEPLINPKENKLSYIRNEFWSRRLR